MTPLVYVVLERCGDRQEVLACLSCEEGAERFRAARQARNEEHAREVETALRSQLSWDYPSVCIKSVSCPEVVVRRMEVL